MVSRNARRRIGILVVGVCLVVGVALATGRTGVWSILGELMIAAGGALGVITGRRLFGDPRRDRGHG